MDHAGTQHGNGTGFAHPVREAAIEAQGLGKRYRRGWALRDVSFRLPAGRVCGLVGPNGAGKSTLMGLATHMIRPTTGALRVFGAAPGSTDAVLRTSFLTQEKPLFRRFTVAETLRLGREFNPRWDQEVAEGIVRAGQVPMHAKVGTLSGGQRTRVAFALAFGKRPDLLILDEPMADLDPLVRRELMTTLTAEAAQHGTTVLVSSHMLAELEYICDYLLVIANGGLRLAGEVDELRAAHALLDVPGTGPSPALPPHRVIESRRGEGRPGVLVRLDGPMGYGGPAAEPPTLEELLLGYLRAPDAPPLIAPSARVGDIHDIITGDRKAVTA
ncbi:MULTISPECIES: ABC transporter ATP-binding protein [Streptomyces]|uniref:ABC transporter ATP-binding protein n=2 Tax=Streptomyces TaxID=1883 RepID=A0ABU2RS96_9ACTN|nr:MULTISPECIES: ABC transporter ATP-binding protein [unclassified Streptomyces]MBK3593370.1 ABC transporter ATP-binding protein [Streptomyces sp. MBT51]MDT0431720.1 ABC transporter ATP-binding protein [Streptomyces sp. DSM 41770]HBF85526.1 ABC transporter ATP-binding protein [Streptomyces sp.]